MATVTWRVMVTSGDMTDCVGAYRWRWLAGLRAWSSERFWPDPKQVAVERWPSQSGRPS